MTIAETLYVHMVIGLCILHAKCAAADFVGFRAFPIELRMMQGIAFPLKTDINQCCRVCANNDTCTSVNYNYISQICEINTLKMKSLEYRVQPSSGWKLYEKLPCGIGYMSSKRCRHIQNFFQHDEIRTHKEASDFCHLLGDNLVTLEHEQDRNDLETDAGLADMYINAYIWLGTSIGTECSCFRRQFADTIMRDCNLNAAIVCERP
ncbi:uncharacterized protein LOC132736470 [Ruditapes philippinarum]|uniref:uncharacterized protein LOC132736470 n=1 Tax=Ruditapes philippinarum TaxID=129788 RepID=UPI00295B38B5|nr:uncharacterized protein LOC132736470 [Ruditapes philippinarum]